MFRVIIKPPTVIFFLLLAITDGGLYFFIPLCAALFHEAGHLTAMFALKYPVDSVEITVFGADIRTHVTGGHVLSDIAVYAAGACGNLLSCTVVYAIFGNCETAEMFCACSLLLAAINLLPIKSLDGGCVFESAAKLIFPCYGERISSTVSLLTLAMLWLVSVWMLLVFDASISLLLFCGYLFASIYLK